MLVHWLLVILARDLVGSRADSKSLVSVFLLARHGERYPCHDLPHPAYPKEFVKMRCRLTDFGARQHFELGKFIRERYSAILALKSSKQVCKAVKTLFLRIFVYSTFEAHVPNAC